MGVPVSMGVANLQQEINHSMPLPKPPAAHPLWRGSRVGAQGLADWRIEE